MQETQKPWYKNHILLLIIAIPLMSVSGSFYTLYRALSSQKSSVIDSYYKQGLTPGKHHYAHESLVIRIEKGVMHVEGLPEPQKLLLTFEHPTLASEDKQYLLTPVQPGLYPLPADAQKALYQQKWYFKIEPQHADGDAHWLQRAAYAPKEANPGTPIFFSPR